MNELLSNRRTPQPRQSTRATELYRLFDKHGILLYVGITMQAAGGRLQQHADTKSWWHLVAGVKIQREPKRTTGDLERDEYDAIVNEFPVFNVKGVSWRTRRPPASDYEIDAIRNRAEIAGAVARLDDAGVMGRVRVFRQTKPDRFVTVEHVIEFDLAGWQPPTLSWARRMLIRSEELLYFDDALFAAWDRQWNYRIAAEEGRNDG